MYRSFVALLVFLLSVPAWAGEAGQWMVRAGATNIYPDDDNGDLNLNRLDPALSPAEIDVDDAWGFTFNISYFFTENWAVELLAAAPYNHDFDIDDPGLGFGISGETDHLPPTLSVQYHFPLANQRFTPYVGVGVNWTIFDDEDLDNLPLDVDLDDSVGLAGQVGVDIDINENWFMNVDLRYIQIESDVEVAGVDVGDVEIDPWLFGLNVGYRF